VVADRTTGVVRRFTIRLNTGLITLAAVVTLPILIGMGARWSATSEIEFLRSNAASLELENASYREATAALTGQIQSLQTTVSELGARAAIDPAAARAIEKLPSLLKARAVGGTTESLPRQQLFSGVNSLEDTFGVLRGLLEGLESRLRVVRRDVERRQALAAATPSIWPVYGWLSGGYGQRTDPFTGEVGFHRGLDISADKGQPVFATADGTVETASYSGDYGNLVVIDHGFGLRSKYGHLSRFRVKAGDTVRRGSVVGYVGATGRATGSHLHYEVLANGRILNPLRLLTARVGH
jgi:murein DD-endopeptidase MepM/ murein hydrolase activator NlpD